MSRRFAGVGVHIRSARLREMLAGAPPVADESIDVPFALAATEFKREQRRARQRRARHRAAQVALMLGLVLAALNLLALFGYAFVTLALHGTEL